MPIIAENFATAPRDVQVQYQAEKSFYRDWQTTDASGYAAGDVADNMGEDISLAMRQFYQSPARARG